MSEPDSQKAVVPAPLPPATRWADQPWFAMLSALSLLVGTGLTFVNLSNTRADARQKQLAMATALPSLRTYFLEIDDTAFSGKEMKESDLTNCPWVDSGVLHQTDDIKAFIGPQLKGIETRLPELKAFEDMKVYDSGLLTLRVENDGSSACVAVTIYADVVELPVGGQKIEWNANVFQSTLSPSSKLERIPFPVGEVEPGKALIVPLYFYAYFGPYVDPVKLAFGRVVIPRLIEYTNVLGETKREEVRIRFNTPAKFLGSHLTGQG